MSSLLGNQQPPKIAIIGGGLAGLSTAYHLIHQCSGRIQITIFDKGLVGTGGASAVAGGLLHPLSPRGKLVHWGIEGLVASTRLIREAEQALVVVAASQQQQRDTTTASERQQVVLREELYRVATSPQQALLLQETAAAAACPQLAPMVEWIPPNGRESSQQECSKHHQDYAFEFGALRLHNGGCQVIHVPSYLKGLWEACQQKIVGPDSCARWTVVSNISRNLDHHDHHHHHWREFDAVVVAAGAGLLVDGLIDDDGSSSSKNLPIQLVGGQSVEVSLDDDHMLLRDAFLCGKYISPLPHPNRVLIGATHEFFHSTVNTTAGTTTTNNNNNNAPWLSYDQVIQELRDRTASIGKTTSSTNTDHIWSAGRIECMTRGVRVQSQRGMHGRLPIIGRWKWNNDRCGSGSTPLYHPNTWIFTGLSSRGLLYHGIYGELLATAILNNSEKSLLDKSADLLWWKR